MAKIRWGSKESVPSKGMIFPSFSPGWRSYFEAPAIDEKSVSFLPSPQFHLLSSNALSRA
jgi:hypothetical protein